MTNGTSVAFESVPGITPSILAAFGLAVKHAYAHAFRVVYLSSLAFAAIAIVASLLVKDVDKYMTNFVNKTIHKPQIHAEKRQDEA